MHQTVTTLCLLFYSIESWIWTTPYWHFIESGKTCFDSLIKTSNSSFDGWSCCSKMAEQAKKMCWNVVSVPVTAILSQRLRITSCSIVYIMWSFLKHCLATIFYQDDKTQQSLRHVLLQRFSHLNNNFQLW